MDAKNSKNKINLTAFCKKAASFLNRKSHWALSFIFLILIGYSAYLWYSHIDNPGWSEARRQEYTSTKQSGSIFNKDRFDEIVRDVESGRSEYQRNVENVPDIFRLK